jgi:hypothetical protein
MPELRDSHVYIIGFGSYFQDGKDFGGISRRYAKKQNANEMAGMKKSAKNTHKVTI